MKICVGDAAEVMAQKSIDINIYKKNGVSRITIVALEDGGKIYLAIHAFNNLSVKPKAANSIIVEELQY